jgi:hypothetical protein
MHEVAKACCKPSAPCRGILGLLSKEDNVSSATAAQICSGTESICDPTGHVVELYLRVPSLECSASALQPLSGLTKLEKLIVVEAKVSGAARGISEHSAELPTVREGASQPVSKHFS